MIDDEDTEEDRRAQARAIAQRRLDERRRSAAGRPSRAPGPRRAAEDIADVMAMAPGRDWSEERWAEHDRRVAAAKERDAMDAIKQRRDDRRRYLGSEDGGSMSDSQLRFIASDLFQITPQIEVVITWRFAGITVLSGGIGRGKTSTAIRWLLDHPAATPGFLRASSLLGVPRATDEGRAIAKRWRHVGCLVIDDLGTESLDDKRSERLSYLEEVIDHFVETHRSLLITTNMPPGKQWGQRYGLRIESRLDRAAWLQLDGIDRRAK